MRRLPIKASGICIALALAVCGLALVSPTRGAPSPPENASQQIVMRCFTINVLIASYHKCQSPDPEFRRHCFEGLGLSTPELGLFAAFRSDGDLHVVDDQIFNNTSTFQFNYAVAYSNVNFFANLTHRLGSFHGSALGLGTVVSGGGLGKWTDVSDVPGGQCGRSTRSASSAVVGAGHRSPASAIAGFVNGFNHDNPSEACGYAKPSLQDKCHSAFEKFGGIKIRVRDLKVASSRRNGNRASVKVTGTGCLGSRCRPLKSASGGRKVTVRCKRVGEKWYVR
jgi:hypothetical protein